MIRKSYSQGKDIAVGLDKVKQQSEGDYERQTDLGTLFSENELVTVRPPQP